MVRTVYALGFSRWKHRPLRLCFSGWNVRFVRDVSKVPCGAVVAAWGRHEISDVEAQGFNVVRVEDGFLRSVGLGADLTRPISWVLDWSGIYFDASKPSDLETLLSETVFPSDLMKRAAVAARACRRGRPHQVQRWHDAMEPSVGGDTGDPCAWPGGERRLNCSRRGRDQDQFRLAEGGTRGEPRCLCALQAAPGRRGQDAREGRRTKIPLCAGVMRWFPTYRWAICYAKWMRCIV